MMKGERILLQLEPCTTKSFPFRLQQGRKPVGFLNTQLVSLTLLLKANGES